MVASDNINNNNTNNNSEDDYDERGREPPSLIKDTKTQIEISSFQFHWPNLHSYIVLLIVTFEISTSLRFLYEVLLNEYIKTRGEVGVALRVVT